MGQAGEMLVALHTEQRCDLNPKVCKHMVMCGTAYFKSITFVAQHFTRSAGYHA
jgi:hypothetical protein